MNANPQIIGKLIILNGTGYQVIGVMPREFDFPKGADVWTPLATTQLADDRNSVFLQLFASDLQYTWFTPVVLATSSLEV